MQKLVQLWKVSTGGTAAATVFFHLCPSDILIWSKMVNNNCKYLISPNILIILPKHAKDPYFFLRHLTWNRSYIFITLYHLRFDSINLKCLIYDFIKCYHNLQCYFSYWITVQGRKAETLFFTTLEMHCKRVRFRPPPSNIKHVISMFVRKKTWYMRGSLRRTLCFIEDGQKQSTASYFFVMLRTSQNCWAKWLFSSAN